MKTTIWECRIGDCQEEMDTARKISLHREKRHCEQYYGPDMQEVICPFCGKSLNAANRLLIQMKIQPRKGGGKWAKLILRMEGNIYRE